MGCWAAHANSPGRRERRCAPSGLRRAWRSCSGPATPTRPQKPTTGHPIDEFPKDVGVVGVASRFLQEVRQDPTQGDVAAVIGDRADLVERRGGGDDRVDIGPGAPIPSERGIYSVM